MLSHNPSLDTTLQTFDDQTWDYNNITFIHGNLSHIWKMYISLTALKILEKIPSPHNIADLKIQIKNFLSAIAMDKIHRLVTKNSYILTLIYLDRLSKKIDLSHKNIFEHIAFCFYAAFEYINDNNDYIYESIIRQFMHLTKNEFKKALNEFYRLLDYDLYVDPQDEGYQNLVHLFHTGLYHTALKDLSLAIHMGDKSSEKNKLLKTFYETIIVKKFPPMDKILMGKLLEYILHFRDNTADPLKPILNILGKKYPKPTHIATKYFLRITKEYDLQLSLFKLSMHELELSISSLDTQGIYFYRNLPKQIISEKYDLTPFIALCKHYLEKNYNPAYYHLLKKISDEYPLLAEKIIHPQGKKNLIHELKMEMTFKDCIDKLFLFKNKKLAFFNAVKNINCSEKNKLQILQFCQLTQDPKIKGKTHKLYNFFIEKFKTIHPELINKGIEYHHEIEKC